jgi:two-component system chemotaxis response regulator CheB
MGYDGAEAMTEVRKRGGHTVAESADSAVVFGMPKELIDRGGAEVVLPAPRIAAQVLKWG